MGRDGPKVTLAFSCDGCVHLRQSSWSRADGASGGSDHCAKFVDRNGSLGRINNTSDTPDWCPLRKDAIQEFMKKRRKGSSV